MSINNSIRAMIVLFVFSFLCWPHDNALARQTIATVGPDGTTCGFRPGNSQGDPIGRALLEGFEEIRIVRQQAGVSWTEDLNVARSVTIRGGFETCADAQMGIENPNAGTLVGAKNGRFLTVSDAPNQTVEVRLRRLLITPVCNASNEAPVQQGGAIFIDGQATVTIERNTVSGLDCPNEEGGLVYLTGGASFRAVDFSVLQGGKAGNGGAIFCEAGGRVFLGPRSNLFSNEAVEPGAPSPDWGNGGGIYADACQIEILSRRSDRAPLSGNRAHRHGGLIYAVNGSDVEMAGGASCDRRPQELAQFPCDESLVSLAQDNDANSMDDTFGEGGVIYAADPATSVSLDGVAFDANSAFLGGAMTVRNNAGLEIGRLASILRPEEGCGSVRCADFSGNVAGGRGGATFFDGAGPVVLWFAEFRGNSANFGSAISLNNQPASASFDMANSIFAGNGDAAEDTVDSGLFEFNTVGQSDAAGHEVNLTGLTIADNPLIEEALFYSPTPAQVDRVSLRGSVLVGDTPVRSAGLDGVSGNCIASNSTLPAGFMNSIEKDNSVALEDVGNRDYRPTFDSPAIDLCSPEQMPGVAGIYDFLHNPRERVGSVFNLDTPNDAGAIELQLEPDDDEVFQDRFEELPPPT